MNANPGLDTTVTTVTGNLRYVQARTTRQKQTWVTALLSTTDGLVPLSIWPAASAACGPLAVGQAVTVTGRVDRRGTPVRLAALSAGSVVVGGDDR